MISCLILAAILFGIIPLLPKAAAYTDLLFVNVFGLPFNSGAVTFMVILFAGLFWGLFRSLKNENIVANTVLLCITTIIIGFSLYATVIIRSNTNTPMNENKPDNPFTLMSYLGRDQYPKGPIIYGEYFGADYDIVEKDYWARMGDIYVKGNSIDVVYTPESKMLFPRMWENRDESYLEIYRSYIGNKGVKVPGCDELKPTFLQNLIFFFDYQVNWMYWRYYMLPLMLGLIGLAMQYSRDKRGCWLNFLMFFMTGIAIVIYINQSPFQVRERDYAYAGSFYFFSAWIGLGCIACIEKAYKFIHDEQQQKKKWVAAAGVCCCLSCSISCQTTNGTGL